MANIREIAAFINNNYTGHTASAREIARAAQRVVETAGRAAGIDGLSKIQRDGWPASRPLDCGLAAEDDTALRAAVRFAAGCEVSG